MKVYRVTAEQIYQTIFHEVFRTPRLAKNCVRRLKRKWKNETDVIINIWPIQVKER